MKTRLNFFGEEHRLISVEREWVSPNRAVRLTRVFMTRGEEKREWGVMVLAAGSETFLPATEEEVAELERALQ